MEFQGHVQRAIKLLRESYDLFSLLFKVRKNLSDGFIYTPSRLFGVRIVPFDLREGGIVLNSREFCTPYFTWRPPDYL